MVTEGQTKDDEWTMVQCKCMKRKVGIHNRSKSDLCNGLFNQPRECESFTETRNHVKQGENGTITLKECDHDREERRS